MCMELASLLYGVLWLGCMVVLQQEPLHLLHASVGDTLNTAKNCKQHTWMLCVVLLRAR